MRVYISFGQSHIHQVNGQTFDRNCLAEIEAPSHEEARQIAFRLFGNKWFTSYPKEGFNKMEYFPRGPIPVNSYD